ncbi:MAG: InlB B-repeat-containing protein, partial [Candidatus Methanomethylophilaceae archaeon]|nr:InlB B-repeat-containing protein [Candidatus Methanomethylophilaceae archaeon]
LIENAWGSIWDFVDNTYVASGKLKAGSGLTPELSNTNVKIVGADYTGGDLSIGSSGTSGNQIATFSQAAASFGVPLTAKTDSSVGEVIPDSLWFKNDQNSALVVGASATFGATAGLSAWSSVSPLSSSGAELGARLAYLMSADAADSPDFYKEVNYHYNGVGTDETKVIIVNNANPITLETPTAPGYTFTGWYTDPGFDPTKRIEKIDTSTPDILDIYAAGAFDIGTNVVGDGTVSTSLARASMGTEITVTATPGDDKMIKSGSLMYYKTGDKTTFSLIDPETMTFTMSGYPVTVVATFVDKVYYVTVPDVEHADITASPAFGPKDTPVTLTVEPKEGYKLTNLTVDGQDVTVQALDGEYSFTLTKDIVVAATFEECSVAYIDEDTETADHYSKISDAMAEEGKNYDVFYIGKDLVEDITVTGTDKTFVLESGKTLTSKVTMNGGEKAVVDLKGVKADGNLFVYFGSIHINGALAEGKVIVVEGEAVIDGDTEFVQGMSLTIKSGSTLSISPGSTLTINEGAIFENNGGSVVIEQSTTGGADGKLVFYTGDIVPGAQNMARVYNTASQYIKVVTGAGTPDEKELAYGDEIPAGTDVTVTFVQAPKSNMDVQYKTFWQERPIKILEEGATSQTVTVEQSIWFYADYPNYDGNLENGMIWEGNNHTQDLTVQYGFMDLIPDEPDRHEATGMIRIPFTAESFGITEPNFTWRVIHLAEPDNADNPDQYVLVTDTYTKAIDENVYLVFDDELLPGVYYLTMIADQDTAHKDSQFGFVNYKFLVKGNDYRIGLTWDSAATATDYTAWITDINGGYL